MPRIPSDFFINPQGSRIIRGFDQISDVTPERAAAQRDLNRALETVSLRHEIDSAVPEGSTLNIGQIRIRLCALQNFCTHKDLSYLTEHEDLLEHVAFIKNAKRTGGFGTSMGSDLEILTNTGSILFHNLLTNLNDVPYDGLIQFISDVFDKIVRDFQDLATRKQVVLDNKVNFKSLAQAAFGFAPK